MRGSRSANTASATGPPGIITAGMPRSYGSPPSRPGAPGHTGSVLRDAAHRLLRWLRGGGGPPAPEEMVDLRVVPFHEGPMTVDALRRAGIQADGHEEFD